MGGKGGKGGKGGAGGNRGGGERGGGVGGGRQAVQITTSNDLALRNNPGC